MRGWFLAALMGSMTALLAPLPLLSCAAAEDFYKDKTLKITVGGAVAMNAAKIVLKVGGSTVTVATGAVVLKSSEIKLTATGPLPELAPMVEDK